MNTQTTNPTMKVTVGAIIPATATAAQLKDLLDALDFTCEQAMHDGVVTDYDCYYEPLRDDDAKNYNTGAA